MRLACTTAILCLSYILSAQESNSLLWEISGNGLNDPSYLYGTMHVSKKIAFRLDDVFFEALNKSEIVALESDPDTWLDKHIEEGSNGPGFGYGFDARGFYMDSFTLSPPDEKELAAYLAFEDRLVNSILYRTNDYAQNFEEETYLDMFIYQAGARFSKPVVALENLEESSALVARASMNAMKQKPDEWLQKKMQGHDLNYLMQDAYRERNIALLDSIDRAMYTDYYRNNMLYIRNENMAQRLDSVIRGKTVFAGIGAAHLPGERGVIQLLRQKGYTVLPMVSEATEKGRVLKERIESKIRNTRLSKISPEDGSFSMMLPNKLYPVSENRTTIYVSPDLANGSYIMINRIPTYSFLKEEGIYSIEDLDALLFENIPGEIITNKRLVRNGFEGLDIVNRLKNGDYQRYQIFLKPLEIIIFKMAGEGDYVRSYSDPIFESLEFREPDSEKVVLQSVYRDFEIEMPLAYSFTNPSRKGIRMIEAYDPIKGSYYFLRRASLNDLKSTEEDAFELRQIQKRFYQDLGLEGHFGQTQDKSLVSHAIVNIEEGKNLYLKAAIKRGDYYLVGVLTSSESDATTYLNSFELKEEYYPAGFQQIKDTALLFTTVSPVKPKKFVENSNSYFGRQKRIKPYNPFTKKTRYQNKNNEAITVEFNKAHDYLSFPHVDSLWALRKKQYTKKELRIIREEVRTNERDIHEIQFIAADSLSSRGILVKNVVKGGVLYELKAVVDTLENPSRFISEFFDNFQPLDNVPGKPFIGDKSGEFFAALREKDSIVLKGYRFPYYDERHIDSLKYYIADFDYDNDTRHIQSHLIQKLGKMDHAAIWDFFTSYYKLCYGNSMAQVKILQALAGRQDDVSTRIMLDLMAKDLPLVSGSKEITKIFKPYREDLEAAKSLYPALLEYSNVQEYKVEIISLLAELKSKRLIKPGLYKKYVKQMMVDAKIQLKRHLGRLGGSQLQRSTEQLSRKQNNAILENYSILLYPFDKEKDVQQFFSRLLEVKAPNVRVTQAALMASRNEQLPKGLIDSLAGNINSRLLLYSRLGEQGKLHLFPSVYKVQAALAESTIFEKRSFIDSKDEIVYLGTKECEYRAKNYTAYFFKLRSKQDFHQNYKLHMIIYEAGSEISSEYFYKNDGYRMSDIDTESTAMDYVIEEFQLKDRSRAVVYHPESAVAYNRLGF